MQKLFICLFLVLLSLGIVFSEDTNNFLPDDSDGIECTKEKIPVCGIFPEMQCQEVITYVDGNAYVNKSCKGPGVFTYDNKCLMGADGAEYLHSGECLRCMGAGEVLPDYSLNGDTYSCCEGLTLQDGVCVETNSTCSTPVCYSGELARDTGNVDKYGCPIETCYSGYYLYPDKKEYNSDETIVLDIQGKTGIINIAIMGPNGSNTIIMEKVLIEEQRTVKISIPAYSNIFSVSGEYLIATSAFGEEIIGGVNTNSVQVYVKVPEPIEVTEIINCSLKGSTSGNECYLAGSWTQEDLGTKWCKGTESCTIKYTALKGEKVTWKSSCGGYQYTKQDGYDETIYFDCSQGEVDSNIIPTTESYFRKAYWQCTDGIEYKEGGDTSCKPYSTWKSYAIKSCGASENVSAFSLNDTCYPDNPEVVPECYTDADCSTIKVLCKTKPCQQFVCVKNICQYPDSYDVPEGGSSTESTDKLEIAVCKDSCSLDNKCYPFGYRKDNAFCSDSGAFTKQLEADNSCNNNFECGSNVCVSNKCISSDLLTQILSWFKNLFGLK